MTHGEHSNSYNGISRFNHWLIAAVVIAMIVLGLIAGEVPREERGFWMSIHIGLGTLAWLFIAYRVIYRIKGGFPQGESDNAMINGLARSAHWLMLIAMLVMIITGPLAVFSGGRDINVFDLFAIPTFMERHEDFHHLLEDIHVITSKIFIGLISLHILGVLWHVFVSKDGTLGRMLRGVKGQGR